MTSPQHNLPSGWIILEPSQVFPGWYAYIEEYPDEGSVGPFDSRTEVEAWLRDNVEEETD